MFLSHARTQVAFFSTSLLRGRHHVCFPVCGAHRPKCKINVCARVINYLSACKCLGASNTHMCSSARHATHTERDMPNVSIAAHPKMRSSTRAKIIYASITHARRVEAHCVCTSECPAGCFSSMQHLCSLRPQIFVSFSEAFISGVEPQIKIYCCPVHHFAPRVSEFAFQKFKLA